MRESATKAEEIALVLEDAILGGELPPGYLLRQEQLSEQFGVSRTPIREALRQLGALGLVSFAGSGSSPTRAGREALCPTHPRVARSVGRWQ